MKNIKWQIIEQLKSEWFPDLKFIYSDEALIIASEILEELLEIEKEKFRELLARENKNLHFDLLEDDGVLDFYWSLLNHLQNVDNTEKIRKIIDYFRPKLQDFSNYVAYNRDYFDKLVYIEKNNILDSDQKRLMKLRIKSFKDRWIDLDKDSQDKIKQINKDLSKLSNDFNNNIVDSEAEFEYLITNGEIIKDLPNEILQSAKNNALEKKKEGYLFDSDPTSYQNIMKYCSDPKVREDFAIANYSFASSGKYDNRENILNILKLKSQKASLLWYKNFAELSLNSKMADSPEQIFELIEGISKKAREKANTEIEELKKYFDLEEINSSSLAYYSTKYKQEKYEIDDKEIKKYFEFENTLDYLHNFVSYFYGIELRKIDPLLYNEDIRAYEVYKDDKFISYYFLDPFYRKNKRPWAWADDLRSKNYDIPELDIKAKNPIVINVCNFAKNPDGKTILSMWDVETLFHEFGHAIHEMLSESKHSALSWFEVEWDFVELPSQIHENWVCDRESLEKLAKHVDTWEKISENLLNKLDSLRTYMSWTFVSRQNEFALLDMSLYSSVVPETIKDLDKKALGIVNKYSIFKRWDDYKMYCSFGHIFWGGYSAGYYSYMWAEIIEADVFARIKEMWMFDRETWDKFVSTILWQWTRKKATELFYDFMWREVDNTAFMERKGL